MRKTVPSPVSFALQESYSTQLTRAFISGTGVKQSFFFAEESFLEGFLDDFSQVSFSSCEKYLEHFTIDSGDPVM